MAGGRSFQREGRPGGSRLAEPGGGAGGGASQGRRTRAGCNGAGRAWEPRGAGCWRCGTCALVRAQTSRLGPRPPSSSQPGLCSRAGVGAGTGIVPTCRASLSVGRAAVSGAWAGDGWECRSRASTALALCPGRGAQPLGASVPSLVKQGVRRRCRPRALPCCPAGRLHASGAALGGAVRTPLPEPCAPVSGKGGSELLAAEGRASWRRCVELISLCRNVGDQVASRWPEAWDPVAEVKHLEALLFQGALLG